MFEEEISDASEFFGCFWRVKKGQIRFRWLREKKRRE